MKYAIAKIQGKQYRLVEGSKVIVNRLNLDADFKELETTEVLLVKSENKIEVGNPYLKESKVILEKLADFSGHKILVKKFHRRKRYQRTNGYRDKKTELLVKKIITK